MNRISALGFKCTPPAEPTYGVPQRRFHGEVRRLEPRLAAVGSFAPDKQTRQRRKTPKKIAQELKHPTPRAAIEGGLEILRELRSAGAILGTWHP